MTKNFVKQKFKIKFNEDFKLGNFNSEFCYF